jgi:hypothetical protein
MCVCVSHLSLYRIVYLFSDPPRIALSALSVILKVIYSKLLRRIVTHEIESAVGAHPFSNMDNALLLSALADTFATHPKRAKGTPSEVKENSEKQRACEWCVCCLCGHIFYSI